MCKFSPCRAERSWSLPHAATELGIPRESVGLYEAGKRRDGSGTAVVVPRLIELACAALAASLTGYAPGYAAKVPSNLKRKKSRLAVRASGDMVSPNCATYASNASVSLRFLHASLLLKLSFASTKGDYRPCRPRRFG